MASSRISTDVICPYYKKDDRTVIKCEGTEDTSIATHIIFTDCRQKHKFMRERCCSYYKYCGIHRMIDERYGIYDE